VFLWVAMSVIGLALVLVGALVDPPARSWIWLLAIVADLAAAAMASRGRWDIAPAHFSERHGLFVIIALGESIIVAAAAVSAEPRTGALVVDTVGALAVAGLLWWTYFGWLKEGLEEGLEAAGERRVGAIASTAFSIGHFPVICGIIAFSVALEEIVHHPGSVPPGEIVAALGAGVVLFVGCSALAYWRASGVVLVARLVVLAATAVALVAVSSLLPGWQLGVVALGLLAIVVLERHGPQPSPADQPDGDLPLVDR
jgi:low temperature requirement protein LtrA